MKKENVDKEIICKEARIIFHKLWTERVGKEGYNKKEWQELQNLLYKLGVYL